MNPWTERRASERRLAARRRQWAEKRRYRKSLLSLADQARKEGRREQAVEILRRVAAMEVLP